MAFKIYKAQVLRDLFTFMKLDANSDVKLLAGGTDFMLMLENDKIRPDLVIDLTAVQEMQGITVSGEELCIGALTTMTELVESALISTHAPLLADAAKSMGNLQVRNLATVGGNLANASRSADVVPALIALDAVAVIHKDDGPREELVEDVLRGSRKTSLEKNEVITCFKLKIATPGTGMAHEKLGRRKSGAISLMTSNVVIEQDQGKITKARLVFGVMTPSARRARPAEEFLIGKVLTEEIAAKAAELARNYIVEYIQTVRPHDLERKELGYAYKLPVLEGVAKRGILLAYEKGGV